ncbi:MAG: hypothetical protein IT347_06385 [Candidatus Eisenbacteria bacterium]|nr:hypothetical protein [Candidatus Eisenbacteria bacterium]
MFELAVSLGPEHPFTGHVLRTGDLGPLRLSDFWSRRRQLAAPIHRRFYKRVGIGWLLTLLSVRGDRYCAINLGRPFTAPDFSQRDREVLGLLEPHLRLALDAAERETAAQEADASALAGLGLSARECDVAGWLARGRTNGEIASILSLRSRTVEKHVERILDKLGVENRTKAAQVVLGRRGARPVSEPADALELVRRVLRPDRTRRVL